MVSPLLKWVGGKSRLVDDILAKFPTSIETYYEPFVGSASVLLAVLQTRNARIVKKARVSDKNERLIQFYKCVQEHPVELEREYKRLLQEYNAITGVIVDRAARDIVAAMTSQESYYYYSRYIFNSGTDLSSIQMCALFMFLNKTCFRGLYREGKNGAFNVPFGNYKKVMYSDNHILEFSKVVVDVEFSTTSFETVLGKKFNPDDFIYLDPPYISDPDAPTFTTYNKDGFDAKTSLELFRLVKLVECGWLMSNSEFASRWFAECAHYNITRLTCRRSINSKNPESVASEILVLKAR